MHTFKLYGTFVSLMITVMLLCDVLAFKIVCISGHYFAASGLIFPLSFFLACIVTEVYGYKLASRIIWLQVICQAIFILVINLFVIFPSGMNSDFSFFYFGLYKNFWHVLVVASFAIPLAYFTTDFIMSTYKLKMCGDFFYFRYFLSNFLGKAILVIISYPVTFSGKYSPSGILHIAVNTFLYKIAMAIVLMPIALVCSILVKKLEKLDFYDYGISYNPLSVFKDIKKGKNLYKLKQEMDS